MSKTLLILAERLNLKVNPPYLGGIRNGQLFSIHVGSSLHLYFPLEPSNLEKVEDLIKSKRTLFSSHIRFEKDKISIPLNTRPFIKWENRIEEIEEIIDYVSKAISHFGQQITEEELCLIDDKISIFSEEVINQNDQFYKDKLNNQSAIKINTKIGVATLISFSLILFAHFLALSEFKLTLPITLGILLEAALFGAILKEHAPIVGVKTNKLLAVKFLAGGLLYLILANLLNSSLTSFGWERKINTGDHAFSIVLIFILFLGALKNAKDKPTIKRLRAILDVDRFRATQETIREKLLLALLALSIIFLIAGIYLKTQRSPKSGAAPLDATDILAMALGALLGFVIFHKVTGIKFNKITRADGFQDYVITLISCLAFSAIITYSLKLMLI